MKIAVAIPRYGRNVLGGAEVLGASYAKKLQERGHSVEVVTTCAESHYGWRNLLPEGVSFENGLTVRRFPVLGECPEFPTIEWYIQKRARIPYESEIVWMRSKGYAPEMVEYLASSDHDCVIFMPYLWAGTYFGVRAVGHKAVVQLLLHDEPYARLATTAEIVASCRGIFFNCEPEKRLARRLFGDLLPPSTFGGLGLDDPGSFGMTAEAFRSLYKLGEAPMLLYAGRWEGGKGVPELVRYVRLLRHRRPRYRLVLIGGGPEGPRRRTPGVVPVGFVSEAVKHGAYRAADVFCQPSRNESLSIVLLEAWLHGTPALVSGYCAVTQHHVRVSGGGLWYRSFGEFEAALELLLEDKKRANAMGLSGRRYVLDVYSWEAVLSRISKALEEWFS